MVPSQPAAGSVPPRLSCILVAYAHPDDESFGPAAILARYARAGVRVCAVYATRGRHGRTDEQTDLEPNELARARLTDLWAAAERMGIADIDVLDYEDGQLDSVPEVELEERFLAAIARVQPEIVLTFGPAGITHHPDHIAVHRAVRAAFQRAIAAGLGVRELYYDAVDAEQAADLGVELAPDGRPNTWIDVADTQPVKLEALRLHARHVVDAREMLEDLERRPRTLAPLFRAWPPVNPGEVVTGFLEFVALPECEDGSRWEPESR